VASILIGSGLAHYRITAAIGAGGIGEVYRATDTKVGREPAHATRPTTTVCGPVGSGCPVTSPNPASRYIAASSDSV
jgi:hypothetical protein